MKELQKLNAKPKGIIQNQEIFAAAAIAQLQLKYYKINKKELIKNMINHNIGTKGHRVDHYLIKNFFAEDQKSDGHKNIVLWVEIDLTSNTTPWYLNQKINFSQKNAEM